MDTKAGYFTNTNTMYQSLFGLDEVFWLVEQDEDRNAQNELDVGLSKIDTEIHSNDHVLRSTFEGRRNVHCEGSKEGILMYVAN